MTYNHDQILNKGCEITFNKNTYYCYNVTSLLHFVKCWKNGAPLKFNKSNALNLPKETLLNLIKNGLAKIEVGNI
jgi:hypothetical protein